jgi:hypothetical protein
VRQSETVGALAKALAEAQGEIENAGKNANNPHFKSKYADLAEILNTARPVLARHGIAVVQSPSYEGGEVQLTTTLMHSSGEWVSGIAAAPATKQDPQGVGSAVTYLRRYALAAFVGIAQEDDDANAASQPRRESRPVEAMAEAARGAADVMSEKQEATIRKLIRSHLVTEEERAPILAKLDAGTMTKRRAMECIDWLLAEMPVRKAAEAA